jgi:lipid-binding SYLF domain-containing protein
MLTTEEVKMKLILAAIVALTPLMAKDNEAVQRLDSAAAVFSEIMAAPDKGIPQEMLEHAHCIVIVPDLKTGAFIVGGKYGKGVLSCRQASGWSAPGVVRIEGGSVGFQIGATSTVGGEGSVAAGPVGRTATAQTDAQMHADILSWSRSQGLFAGISLQGATLRPDTDDNESLYGARLGNREIVTKGRAVPASAAKLINMLNKYSFREEK